MNWNEYRRKQAEENLKLMLYRWNNPQIKNWDIWNLKVMLTEIDPNSRAWRRGDVRALRRAIRALEREEREKKARR